MKKSVFLIIGAMLLTTTFAAVVQASAKEGGGGAQIEAAFRLKGYQLIERIGNNPDANTECSSSMLRETLDSTKIDVVRQLTDPTTGRPITQLLDAWTVPDHIQLLRQSWQNLVGIHSIPYRVPHSVDVLVLHEIYRATGKCDDNNFKLSMKVYSLISGASDRSTPFSEQSAYADWTLGEIPAGSTVTLLTPAIFNAQGVFELTTGNGFCDLSAKTEGQRYEIPAGKKFSIKAVTAKSTGGDGGFQNDYTIELNAPLGLTIECSYFDEIGSYDPPDLLIGDLNSGSFGDSPSIRIIVPAPKMFPNR